MNTFKKATTKLINAVEELNSAINYRIGTSAQPQYNPPPMPPVKPAKEKENKTMYGLKVYIPFEDLSAYVRNNIDEQYKDFTFTPVKTEINELDMSVEISLVSVNPIETDGRRYKLDLSRM